MDSEPGSQSLATGRDARVASARDRARFRGEITPLLLVVAFALVFSVVFLESPFHWWYEDDPWQDAVAASIPNPVQIFTDPVRMQSFGSGASLVPIQLFSYWMDLRLFGNSPVMANLRSLFWLVAAAILFFALSLELTRDRWISAAFAAFWVCLPSTISVHPYLSARHYLEGAAWALGACLAALCLWNREDLPDAGNGVCPRASPSPPFWRCSSRKPTPRSCPAFSFSKRTLGGATGRRRARRCSRSPMPPIATGCSAMALVIPAPPAERENVRVPPDPSLHADFEPRRVSGLRRPRPRRCGASRPAARGPMGGDRLVRSAAPRRNRLDLSGGCRRSRDLPDARHLVPDARRGAYRGSPRGSDAAGRGRFAAVEDGCLRALRRVPRARLQRGKRGLVPHGGGQALWNPPLPLRERRAARGADLSRESAAVSNDPALSSGPLRRRWRALPRDSRGAGP